MATASFPTSVHSFGAMEKTHNKLDQFAAELEAVETALGIGAKAGAAITATGSIAISGGKVRHIGSLDGNVTLTLSTTGASAGDKILFVRTGTTAHTVAVGSLFTMPVSTAGAVEIEYSGSAWVLSNVSLKPIYATGGAVVVAAPVAGSAVTLAGDLTTSGGNLSVAVPAAGSTVTLAGNFTHTGPDDNLTLTTTATTNVTLPTTGTLATLAGTETLSGKRFVPAQGTIVWDTNADTIAVGDGVEFDVPTTGGASDLTLGDTGAVEGDKISVHANGTANGHTVTVKDHTTATIVALTASKMSSAVFRFNGTAFKLYSIYQEA